MLELVVDNLSVSFPGLAAPVLEINRLAVSPVAPDRARAR
jgi:hypothetical protein